MRTEKQKKRKKKFARKLGLTFVTLLTIFVGLVGYMYWQYRDGVEQAKSETSIQQEEYVFDGNEDINGNTNVLLLGSDTRGEKQARSDTIMIAQYNPNTGKPKLVSIMRDSYVDIPGHGKNKINTAFSLGGPDLLRKTIKENFGIELQYYAIIDFQGFEKMIDVAFPDGVEIEVEKQMSEKIGVTINPGLQRLDGEHLLGYVRFRQDKIGDFGRVERQQQAIQAIKDQLISLDGVTKLPKLVGAVTPFVNTDIGTTDTLFIGKDVLTGGASTIETLRIPVDNGYTNERYSGAGAVLDLDFEKNSTAIQEFLSK
ncbi:LCP family protein [Metabacillus herbersteinensis]|uniref:Regulatory protein MsrR n=1 Tax=Metabacillus herbersteinensis TaxID=283816 RepID=A0ABV6GJN6_9BACI